MAETGLPKWTNIWWEGSVLNFLKAEWKVSDTGSAHWASSFKYICLQFFSIELPKTNFYLNYSKQIIYTFFQIWGVQMDQCLKFFKTFKSYLNELKFSIGHYVRFLKSLIWLNTTAWEL